MNTTINNDTIVIDTARLEEIMTNEAIKKPSILARISEGFGTMSKEEEELGVDEFELKKRRLNAFGQLPSLSARIRTIAYEAMDMGSIEWANTYREHPTYEPLRADIIQMISRDGFNATLDYLESFGVETLYDRSTRCMTLGLGHNLFQMNVAYNPPTDSRRLLERINATIIDFSGIGTELETNTHTSNFEKTFYMCIEL